jgi:hypothetical protein
MGRARRGGRSVGKRASLGRGEMARDSEAVGRVAGGAVFRILVLVVEVVAWGVGAWYPKEKFGWVSSVCRSNLKSLYKGVFAFRVIVRGIGSAPGFSGSGLEIASSLIRCSLGVEPSVEGPAGTSE